MTPYEIAQNHEEFVKKTQRKIATREQKIAKMKQEISQEAFAQKEKTALEAATKAFCSYHKMRLEALTQENKQYIRKNVLPIFLAATNISRVQWPCL